MTIRSPPLFVVSLLLLAASATLGAVLLHDGEVGTDEARIAYADAGDAMRLKGTLDPFQAPEQDPWTQVTPWLHHSTYRLLVEGSDAQVLVTGLAADLEGAVVVVGTVTTTMDLADTSVLVLDADAVSDPFFTW